MCLTFPGYEAGTQILAKLRSKKKKKKIYDPDEKLEIRDRCCQKRTKQILEVKNSMNEIKNNNQKLQ